MLIRPDRRDLTIVGFYSGRILTGLGLIMFVPAALGFLRGEIDDATALLVGAGVALVLGQLAEWRLYTRRSLDQGHAMTVVGFTWLAAAFIGAIPLYLSGHYGGFIDAYFDAMSGFSTAGLAVISDLDHLGDAINMWRHIMQFLGGQGLVLVALSLFGGAGGLVGLYVGEGREDRIMPNIRHTAQFIWRVALGYGIVGTLLLWVTVIHAGFPPLDGLLHAAMLFMAAFDTAGFAPTSVSLGLYQSGWVEGVASVLMIAGSLSFALHYQLLRRRRYGELFRSMETRLLAFVYLSFSR